MEPSSVVEIMKELEEIGRGCEEESARVAGAEVALVNLGLAAILGMVLAAFDAWAREQRRAVWRQIPRGRTEPTMAFVTLLTNAANSLLAVRRLAQQGLTREARTVFRQFTEVGDLAVVFVGDSEQAALYLDTPEDWDDARIHWDEHFTPAKVRKRVDLIEKELYEMAGNTAAAKKSRSSRWDLYQWLTKAAHIDYTSLTVEGIAGDGSGRYNLNLGGRIGPQTVATLRHLAAYTQFLVDMLSRLLHERHGWNSENPDLEKPLGEAGIFLEFYRAWDMENP